MQDVVVNSIVDSSVLLLIMGVVFLIWLFVKGVEDMTDDFD